MSQTSGPKRDVITVASEVDGELVVKQVYAVRGGQREVNKRGDGHDVQRLRKALLKRLIRRVKRLNRGVIPEFVRV